MTLQDLKNNREQIIKTLTELVGAENVTSIMKVMVGGLDMCDTIEDLINASIEISNFKTFSRVDTGNRFILGQLALMED